MSNRDNLPIEWKRKLGNTCCNCGSTEDIQYHHIIPVGGDHIGNNILSNMCALCSKCHNYVEMIQREGRHSFLVKQGMKKAQENGIHIGKPAADYESIMASIAKHLTVFESGDLTEDEIIELNNIKPTTFHKVRRMLYEDLEKDEWKHNFSKPNRLLKIPLYKNQILEAREKGIPIEELQNKRLNK